jgi:hypothetical protein
MVKANVLNTLRLPVMRFIVAIPARRIQADRQRALSRPVNPFLYRTFLHALERSDVRTETLSEADFNGVG